MGRLLALPIALLVLALTPAASLASPGDLAAPSCAEGPQRVGDALEGTPCGETIVVPPGVAAVDGGGGDDTILAPIAAAIPCEAICLSVGSQTFEGGPGNDVVFGERGNDVLRGGEGNDRLYGGIGDDKLEGGPGNDLLGGGFGADTIDGQAGDDYVRGDGTIDHIHDSGGGADTLSYATGIAPGFGGGIDTGAGGFPGPGAETGERGVHLDLTGNGLNGNNGIAAEGGGFDEVEAGVFEVIVGTAFPDFVEGGEAPETIFGGGGGDVIRGNGGNDQLHGGADGDLLDGGEGDDGLNGGAGGDNCLNAASTSDCEGTAQAVSPRDGGKVCVGLMTGGAPGIAQGYATGSSGDDTIVVSYAPGTVSLTLSGASFDTGAGAASGCAVTPTAATCLFEYLDSIVLAGLGGDDHLTATGFPQATATILLGGEGEDGLSGGEGSEDALVDGRGGSADVLSALGRDDVLLHEGAADTLLGGDGNDLFLSTSICDGETIDGGEGRDNSSWARLLVDGVEARLDTTPARVGRFGAAGDPGCGGEPLDTMISIEDLEGSEQPELFVGDVGPNQLLGHGGPDEYLAGAGADTILANSGDSDPLIDCGSDSDLAVIDIPTPQYADAEPIDCERVRQGAVEEFRTVTELPPAPLAPPQESTEPPEPPKLTTPPRQPRRDRVRPRTLLRHHPPEVIRTTKRQRRVSFRFVSSEPGSSFRCRIDRRPFRPCASPRAYTVRIGRHAVRIAAVDAAGNPDRTPATWRFRLIRRR
jgi:Ca2+-binding RTX toxin-like protein